MQVQVQAPGRVQVLVAAGGTAGEQRLGAAPQSCKGKVDTPRLQHRLRLCAHCASDSGHEPVRRAAEPKAQVC